MGVLDTLELGGEVLALTSFVPPVDLEITLLMPPKGSGNAQNLRNDVGSVSAVTSTMFCYRCKTPGHWASQCASGGASSRRKRGREERLPRASTSRQQRAKRT